MTTSELKASASEYLDKVKKEAYVIKDQIINDVEFYKQKHENYIYAIKDKYNPSIKDLEEKSLKEIPIEIRTYFIDLDVMYAIGNICSAIFKDAILYPFDEQTYGGYIFPTEDVMGHTRIENRPGFSK